MPRKIQRKPRRYLAVRASKEPAPAKGISIQEAFTILGGLTGIIVAILWVAGRIYMTGYFGAMNIPSFQTNFSIWEYAEASWLKLIFFFLRKTYTVLVFLAVISLAIPLLTFLLQIAFPKLRVFDAFKNLLSQVRALPLGIRYALTFSILIIFSYLLLLAFIDINNTGLAEGRDLVLTSSYTVEVYSKDYLPVGSPSVLPNTRPAMMRYSGLRLLTFNNGKYYLFREVDPATCRPVEVFVIPDSPDIHLVLRAIAPLEVACAITPAASPPQ